MLYIVARLDRHGAEVGGEEEDLGGIWFLQLLPPASPSSPPAAMLPESLICNYHVQKFRLGSPRLQVARSGTYVITCALQISDSALCCSLVDK